MGSVFERSIGMQPMAGNGDDMAVYEKRANSGSLQNLFYNLVKDFDGLNDSWQK